MIYIDMYMIERKKEFSQYRYQYQYRINKAHVPTNHNGSEMTGTSLQPLVQNLLCQNAVAMCSHTRVKRWSISNDIKWYDGQQNNTPHSFIFYFSLLYSITYIYPPPQHLC